MVDGIGIPDPGAEVPWPSAEPDPQHAEANLARDLAEQMKKSLVSVGTGFVGSMELEDDLTIGIVRAAVKQVVRSEGRAEIDLWLTETAIVVRLRVA